MSAGYLQRLFTRKLWIVNSWVTSSKPTKGKGKKPFTRQQNFSRVQIESICRRQFQCGSKKVQLFFDTAENIVGEEEIAGY